MDSSENEVITHMSEQQDETKSSTFLQEPLMRPISAKINKVTPMSNIKNISPTEDPSGTLTDLEKTKTLDISEDITFCPVCKKCITDPHSLPCFHAFCKNCLVESLIDGKIECCLCDKIHTVSNLERVIKPSNMIRFLINFKKNKFDAIQITEGEKIERDGIW